MFSIIASYSKRSHIYYTSYLNAAFYISKCDQSGCVSSHQEKSKFIGECYDVGKLYSTILFLMWQSLLFLIPLSFLISYKLPFPIVGFKYLPSKLLHWYLLKYFCCSTSGIDPIHTVVTPKICPSVGACTFRTIPQQRPVSVIYYNLSLINSILLTPDMITLCTINYAPVWWLTYTFPRLSTTLIPSKLLYCPSIWFILCQYTYYYFQWSCPIKIPNIPCSKFLIHFSLPRSFQSFLHLAGTREKMGVQWDGNEPSGSIKEAGYFWQAEWQSPFQIIFCSME
jgi:hypothetical protein